MIDKPILIPAHLEKVVRLLDRFRFNEMVGTLSVNQLALGKKAFAPKAIEPFILTKINIARVINFLQYLLHNSNMGWIGSPDKIIIFNVKLGP
jgi:hypothetical protein